ncbi:MAG: hypothetical protein H8E85_06135 [Candidatus Marinimicrobia bacterium]|nr:hypothetical protein [Candidatus Neomarinimicrobiota bacterium]
MLRIIGLLILTQFGIAQQVQQGSPYSRLQGLDYNYHIIDLPTVDAEALLAEDSNRATGTPYRYGFKHYVDFSTEDSGVWEETEDGGLFWQISVKSENAYALSFEYDNFFIPEGGELYVLSPGYEMIQGAYTSVNNSNTGRFATPHLKGDTAIIEYYQPAGTDGILSLVITEIIHDYRDIMRFNDEDQERNCGENAVCYEDEGYQEPIDAGAWLDMGGFICSGAMVNNVRQDLSPYFLTAWHCVDGDYPPTFRFYFNYETTSCSGSWASNGSYAYSSDLVADSDGMDSDWALLLIDDDIEESWEVFYAGWDATGDYPMISCNVHHPGGDPKKINLDDDMAYGDYWNNTGGATTHWKVNWDEGGTEGGSSGSALFDDQFRIVGQLSGGPAGACGTTYALYGKFSRGWDWDMPSNRRMIDWLDPDYTGTLVIDGTYVEVTGMPGDLNSDDLVNILDIIALANLIFEGNPTAEDMAAADLNGDGILNILDIIAIVNIILDN